MTMSDYDILTPDPVNYLAPAEDQGFSVRRYGGPTKINLAWEQLTTANGYLGEATAFSGDQVEGLMGVTGMMATAGLPLHWRIPVLGVRLATLSLRTLGVKELVEQGRNALDAVHQAYRDAENTVQRWMDFGVILGDSQVVFHHFVTSPGQGDLGLAYDWAASAAVFTVGEAYNQGPKLLFKGSPLIGYAAMKALEKDDHGGLLRFEMENHQLHLGVQTQSFSHEGDQSLHHYFEQMEQISADGDLSVTVTHDDLGQPVYMVHLAGMDLDPMDMNREDGRGYLGYIDTVLNDSEQLSEVIDQALAEAGADPGAAIALSGYSLGGIGATNLTANTRLQEKYDFKAVATLGAAGQNKQLPHGTSVVHFQDGRDPVTNIFGQAHQESSDRLTVHYDFHNRDVPTEGIFGGAHAYQHHLDALEKLEECPEAYLTPEEQAMLAEFGQLYSGEAETYVFDTGWQEKP